MPDTVTLSGAGALRRLIIPSSFAVKFDPLTVKKSGSEPLASFRIGKGHWIIQAKASISSNSAEFPTSVSLVLNAVENGITIASDHGEQSVSTFSAWATAV